MIDPVSYAAGLEEQAAKLAVNLSEKRLWLRGPTGSGRHAIAHRLASQHGIPTIEVPPPEDLDAAFHALVQAALHAGCVDEIIDHPQRDLHDHAKQIGGRMAERSVHLALLLPHAWAERRGAEDVEAPWQRLACVLRGLADDPGLRFVVITGMIDEAPIGLETTPPVTLHAARIGSTDIRVDKLTGKFQAAAEQVASWMNRHKIFATPLEVRLQVGIVGLGGSPSEGKLEALARRLALLLQQAVPELTVAVRRLLLARRAIPRAEIARVSGVPSELSPLLTDCIGYGREEVRVPERTREALLGQLRVHRVSSGARHSDHDGSELGHAALARFHETHDGAVTPRNLTASQAIHWLEKVHHLAWGGEATSETWARQQLLGRERRRDGRARRDVTVRARTRQDLGVPPLKVLA